MGTRAEQLTQNHTLHCLSTNHRPEWDCSLMFGVFFPLSHHQCVRKGSRPALVGVLAYDAD